MNAESLVIKFTVEQTARVLCQFQLRQADEYCKVSTLKYSFFTKGHACELISFTLKWRQRRISFLHKVFLINTFITAALSYLSPWWWLWFRNTRMHMRRVIGQWWLLFPDEERPAYRLYRVNGATIFSQCRLCDQDLFSLADCFQQCSMLHQCRKNH